MTKRSAETWTITKPAIVTRDGLVASQHHLASDVGARVLAEGGNAIDAAVVTSLALGSVEPWMSGLGGGGFMLVYLAREDRVHAIDFGMVAPRALNADDYRVVEGTDKDLFAWPAVVEDRNVLGPHSFAVPGQVAGLALALQKFGTRNWADSLAPAVELAEQGITVDWYATLKITAAAPLLTRFDESRRIYLPNGFAPAAEWAGPLPRIRLGKLASTLQRLAQAGARDLYEGELAKEIVADATALGSKLSCDDLAGYQARLVPASEIGYRGARICTPSGLNAGPSLERALALLADQWSPDVVPDAASYGALAGALQQAYAERLETMGDTGETRAPSCTTHLGVVDKEGNMVALTQTLLSVFGSKVVLPRTGILMNNGIMWFDPRPGRPNSIRPGRRPLSNMCPAIVERADGLRFAVGASGGRRIMPAVMQLVSFIVDFGMDLDGAMHQARIDVSGDEVATVDAALGEAVIEALGARFKTACVHNAVYPSLFACPNVVGRDSKTGRNTGAAFVMSPSAGVSTASF